MARKEKVVIYQVFTRLFGNRNHTCKENGTLAENGCGKMVDFNTATLKQIKELGITHIWYTGIIRHATQTDYTDYGIPCQNPHVVKGKAGSPYAIADYYDIDPDIAVDIENRMREFEELVERTHRLGMKVLIDFVPNHVARQYRSIGKPKDVKDLGEDDDLQKHFSPQNNFYYCWGQAFDSSALPPSSAPPYTEIPAKATGNDHFDHHPGKNDWYETVKLNYGIDYCDAGGKSEHFSPTPDTWTKMTDILLFWAGKGIDGFRCDMAEMVPADFWLWATQKVRHHHPHIIFIGEVYNPHLYRRYIGAGFDYLYDKVGMYDCIRNVMTGKGHTGEITHQWQSTDDIRNAMLYFLENHDEQRIASDFFAEDARKGIPALMVSALLYSNPFMLYAGQEFGEQGMEHEGFSGIDGRTSIFDYWTVGSLFKGFYNRQYLGKEEKQLESVYRKILRMANQEKALREGSTFDLMYVNQEMAEKQYAFLRKSDDELIVVIANFSLQATHVHVNIPEHAFHFMQIPSRQVTATDLLSCEQVDITLKREGTAISTSLMPLYGKILKIKL